MNLSERLIAWFEAGHRDLPWRRTRDPYRIWLSEIMLQQTRAAAAIPYYEAFLSRFPDVQALARASEADVLAAWSGLGYYSRARNLRASAARIVESGGFPATFDAIRALPGVGPYTAAAVASIAFHLPHAVLDGNVLRVVSRVANDSGDIGRPVTRKRFQALADQWLDRERPGAFNQATMELGATVCLPRAPLCLVCPLSSVCQARLAGTETQLPVKLRKGPPEEREAAVVVIERAGSVLLRQRDAESRRMASFWELPAREDVPDLRAAALLGQFRHTIVNQCWSVAVWTGTLPSASVPAGWRWVERDGFGAIPVTTATRKAMLVYAER